uniref:DDE-1 domain-containing protein n=1 Tax=Nothobranchius kadleci TaxID=1051664 RepID=A0A1A8DN46_NOTKA
MFRSYCTKKMADKNIQPQHITNMDEVLLTFDIPVNQTVEKMGTSTVSVWTTSHEKSCFTVVLACQADGQKLLPMVIFKRKTLPKEKFPAGVIIKMNPKGWMDEDMMAVVAAGAMLICDSMRAHLTDAVKIQVKRMNTELTIIPGGLTKELQPLDIGMNRSFKAKV